MSKKVFIFSGFVAVTLTRKVSIFIFFFFSRHVVVREHQPT
jgi:hypothetical protein